MSDIRARLETLEQQAAEYELVGSLATEQSVRDANRKLARDLREEAFKLRNELAKLTGLSGPNPRAVRREEPDHA